MFTFQMLHYISFFSLNFWFHIDIRIVVVLAVLRFCAGEWGGLCYFKRKRKEFPPQNSLRYVIGMRYRLSFGVCNKR